MTATTHDRAPGTGSEGAVTVRGLARSFKTRDGLVEAVRGIDFDVRPGEIVGLLGPNGAGKTTTLRMLTTLLEPTGGSATVPRRLAAAAGAGGRAVHSAGPRPRPRAARGAPADRLRRPGGRHARRGHG